MSQERDLRRVLARLRELLGQGATLQQAARDRQVRLPLVRVHRLAAEHNLPRRRRALPRVRREKAGQLFDQATLSTRQIARAVKAAKSTIARWRRVYLDRQAQAEDSASAALFRPRRLRKARHCPVHGLVQVWPCVACAAVKETRTGKR